MTEELLMMLENKEIEPKYERMKADLFSLGMTLLYTATLLDPANHCYDYLQNNID